MLDLTPGEMIIALRRGEIDLTLTGNGVDLLSRDFYTHKLASVRSLVSLPLDHPLASQKTVAISQLKDESFVAAPDSVAPGYNQKIVQFCRRFGKFHPRFVTIGQPASLAEGLVLAANEGAISLHPVFISHLGIPNVVMVPLTDKEATWDLFVVWQRGKASGPLRALLEALQLKPGGAQSLSEKAFPAMREQLRSE
jgi:DNA-binding transcriptional LysR family regulator